MKKDVNLKFSERELVFLVRCIAHCQCSMPIGINQREVLESIIKKIQEKEIGTD